VLARGRAHRSFRRIRGARLEELLSQAQPGGKAAGGKGAKGAATGGAGEDAAGETPPGDGTAP
jgi:hypothetical protein